MGFHRSIGVWRGGESPSGPAPGSTPTVSFEYLRRSLADLCRNSLKLFHRPNRRFIPVNSVNLAYRCPDCLPEARSDA